MTYSPEWHSLESPVQQQISSQQYSLPIPVGKIANSLGIKILISTMPGSISGEIKESPPGTVTIKVNRHDCKERQRFTIAHEIAHFLLHRSFLASGITDDTLYRSKLSDSIEREANRLGADIIMPPHLIKKAYQNSSATKKEDKIIEVASLAEVSVAALKARLNLR